MKPTASTVSWLQREHEAKFMLSGVRPQIQRGLLCRWEHKGFLTPEARVWKEAMRSYRESMGGGAGHAAAGAMHRKIDPSRGLPLRDVMAGTRSFLLHAVDGSGDGPLATRWSVPAVEQMDLDDLERMAEGKGACTRDGVGWVDRPKWCKFVRDWLQHAALVLKQLSPLLLVQPRYRFLFKPFVNTDNATNFLWQLAKPWNAVGLGMLRCGSQPGSLAMSYYSQDPNAPDKFQIRRGQATVLEGGRLRRGGTRGLPVQEFDNVARMLAAESKIQSMLVYLKKNGVDSVKLESKEEVVKMLEQHWDDCAAEERLRRGGADATRQHPGAGAFSGAATGHGTSAYPGM